jgi:putative SOS response-associated peptidase YedK
LLFARWALIPFWWKQPKPPKFTFNTRIEEAATKPMWRQVVKTSRCLVPAVGWYEWQEVEVTDPATGDQEGETTGSVLISSITSKEYNLLHHRLELGHSEPL